MVRQAVLLVKMCKGCIEGSRRVAGTILMGAPRFGTIEDLIGAAEDRRECNASALANSICPVVRKQRKHNKGSTDIAVASGYVTKMQEELNFKG